MSSAAEDLPDLPPPEDGLTPLIKLPLMERSFVSGGASPERLSVRYFLRERDQALVAAALFGPLAEGPPGHAHGGSMAALVDELMGLCAWTAGHMVVAARLTTDFKRMLPLGTLARAEAWVESADGKKIVTRARLSSGSDTVHAEAEGLFVVIDSSRMQHLVDRRS